MKNNRSLALWVIIGFVVLLLFTQLQPSGPQGAQTQLAYSDFIASVNDGRVSSVTIRGQEISGRYEEGQVFRTFAPDGTDVVATLREKGVRIVAEPPPQPSMLWSLFISAFPRCCSSASGSTSCGGCRAVRVACSASARAVPG